MLIRFYFVTLYPDNKKEHEYAICVHNGLSITGCYHTTANEKLPIVVYSISAKCCFCGYLAVLVVETI